MEDSFENINPKLYRKIDERKITAEDEDEDIVDEFDAREIFGMYLLMSQCFLNFDVVYNYFF